jgi:DNA-binding NarL/FixJ family response regulator
MVAVAIFSSDPVLRRNLEQLSREEPAVVIVGIFDQPSSFPEPVSRDRVDVLLVDVPTQELLAKYRGRYRGIPLVVLLDGTDSEDTVHALSAGARAVLDRSASRSEMIAAIKAVAAGLVVVLPDLLAALLRGAPPDDQYCRRRQTDARTRSARGNGRRCFKQSDCPPAGHFVPHRQVSRCCDPRQARC